jgi:alcohol dehydrogenase (cytochrome c)/quinohemoprotein ethanol dehydrogenase
LKAVRGHLVAGDPVQRKGLGRRARCCLEWRRASDCRQSGVPGEANGRFSAYDATTGSRLWSFAAQEGIVAPPVSYAVDSVQYVAVLAGWGGVLPLLTGEIARKGSLSGSNGRILVFRLDGDARLPARIGSEPAIPAAPTQFADTTTVEAGMRLYQRFCGGCHGGSAVSGGVLPDLRHSALLANREG